MHPVLLDSPIKPQSHLPTPNRDPPHASIIKESIVRFLVSVSTGSLDLSPFKSVFSRLIQSRPDPPLEVIWFYAAVIHHEALESKRSALDRAFAIRDLFQLLIACSGPSDGPKSVALVAPVVAELFHVADDVEGMGERKVRREVERLVEGLMGYVSICSTKGFNGCGELVSCFGELIRVWTVRRADGGREMEWFLPLVNDEVRAGINAGMLGVDDLAGVVMVQALLLRMMMKLGSSGGVEKAEAQSEIRGWAVGVMTGFGSSKFFEILLRLMLGSRLPSVSVLNPKDERILRHILYDSTLLVDYSFLCPSEVGELHSSLSRIHLQRLVLFHDAIQESRKIGDHSNAIAYTNAFSRSYLPSTLVQCAKNQTGKNKMEQQQPNATTPQAFIKWLLGLRKQGIRVLEDDILACCDRLSFDEGNLKIGDGKLMQADMQRAGEELFFFDTKGDTADNGSEEYEMELAGDAFLSAARAMKSEANGSKKRKGSKGKTQSKFVKYKLHDATVNDYFSVKSAHDANSGSEVENPLSDGDVEEMEE